MQNLRMPYTFSPAGEHNPLSIASQGQNKATKIITYQESQIAKALVMKGIIVQCVNKTRVCGVWEGPSFTNQFARAWYVCILLSAPLQFLTAMHLYRINEHGDTTRTPHKPD